AVERAMAILAEAENDFSNMKTVEKGVINVAASDNVINYFLLDPIKRFRALYPKVSQRIANATSRGSIELVKSGKADVAFVNLPTESAGVEFYGKTGKIHDVFVAGKKFSHLFDKSLSLSDVSHLPLLFLDSSAMTRKKTEQFAQSLGVKLEPAIELASIELVVNMAAEGMGIACVPEEYVKKQIEAGTLKKLDVVPEFPVREIGVVCAKNTARSYALRLFLQTVTDFSDAE
ncbi:MAG: LysR family transcriptional regulator substrate-binding protein, partial [Clostridia bacterium]|nr:LysR family transcriptional regulator substrate-binding protein [Clostridia bacterium]